MLDADLLNIIGMIYDAALEPGRWELAIDAVRARLNFYNAMLTLIDLPTMRAVVAAQVNVPPEYDPMQAPHYLASVSTLWGGPQAIAKHTIEEPVILSEASDPANWPDNLYYRDFAQPQGIFDVMAVALVRTPGLVGDLGFGRHVSAGRPGAVEADQLRILAPHLRRAMMVSGLLDTGASALATLEATVEATPAGVVLVDRDMRIVHANTSAIRMLDDRDPIRRIGDRLELRHELLSGQLATAVAGSAESVATIGRRGLGIPARRADGSPLVLHVMPLTPRQLRQPMLRGAVAAIFIAENDGSRHLGDALGLLFGLTPTEARVFELAAGGQSSRQMAEVLGVAPSTIKTHLLHVYDKTGCHQRSELASLARDVLP